MGVIYKISNKINGKCYIGMTTKAKPLKRWHQHIHALLIGKGNRYLQLDFNLYGRNNFKFEIILECPNEDLPQNEIKLIKENNSLVPNGSEAARQTGFCKATIQNGLKTPNKLRCGYYWREG